MTNPQEKNTNLKMNDSHKSKSHADKQNLHNQEAQRQRRKSIRKTTFWFCKTFPECFHWHQPKALKRNIQQELYTFLAKAESKSKLPSKTLIRNALNYYTGRLAYLKAIVSQTHRINLKGEEQEEICQTHKEYAQHLFQQKQAARKMLKEKHKTIEKSKS